MEARMPLSWTGESQQVLFNTHYRATDENGDFVTVTASQEALMDKGFDAVWDMANTKYDAKQFQTVDGVKVVKVTTGDWPNA
jgi:hypothetical protein